MGSATGRRYAAPVERPSVTSLTGRELLCRERHVRVGFARLLSGMRVVRAVGFVPKRRPKREPTVKSLLHVEWLIWLVDEFGACATADWQEPPISLEAWQQARELAAHEVGGITSVASRPLL